MSSHKLWYGRPYETFTMTRSQLQHLSFQSIACGRENGDFTDITFEAVDTLGHERATHRRTVEHLREARRELLRLRVTVAELDDELDGWRGETGADKHAPGHYVGDGYVTCSRAMEAMSRQVPLRPRTSVQAWWWMCAFKYVWRMWFKDDPAKDARKAIGCLLRVAESLEEGANE